MEYRKLINFGNTSLVISLPKKWLTQHNLKKGDALYLEDNLNCISIFPRGREEEKEEEKEVIINVDEGVMETIKRKIFASYIQDYNNIVLTGKTLSKKSAEIRQLIQKLIALEIIEESSTRMVAKGFVNMKEVNIDQSVRRIDNMIRSMMSDLLSMPSCGKVKKQEISSSIGVRDQDVNKLVYLTYRFINHTLSRRKPTENETALKLLRYWNLVLTMERVGDQTKRIARTLCNIQKKEVLKEVEEITKKANKLYEITMRSIYTKNKELVYKASLERTPLLCHCDDLVEKYGQNKAVLGFSEKSKQLIANIHSIMRTSY